MLWVVVKLILGLLLILAGANYLVDGSSSIARKYGISEFVVGLTIVGFGTSAPEMVVSFISAIQGNSDISVGNIIGSNIANTFLILGVVALVAPIALTKTNIRRDIPICLLASVMLFIFGSDTIFLGSTSDTLSRIDGGIFLLCFSLFMYYSFKTAKSSDGLEQVECAELPKKQYSLGLSIVFIAGGLAGLIFGGQLFVNSGVAIASHLGISDAFIGITLMAVGTSLPELAASLVAAIKKRGQMALGNIIGSNIFNILFILGVSSLIHPLSMDNITMVDLSMMLFTSVAIFISAYSFKKKIIDRWEGLIFVLLYFGYMGWLIYNL